MSTKKDTYINFILEELRGGKVSFEVVLKSLNRRYPLSRPQFSTYWKQAQLELKQERERAKKIREDILKIQIENNCKKAYKKTSTALLKIINKKTIIEEKVYDPTIGKVVVFNREPNGIEIVEAIKEYNRINGV